LSGSAEHAFLLPIRVYIEDTDAGGIVYYVNYLKYFERARTELMRAAGFAKAGLMDEKTQFVVHGLSVDYHKPAKLADELIASASVERCRRASMWFAQRIMRGDEVLCSAQVKVACVQPGTLRPQPLPRVVRDAFSGAC